MWYTELTREIIMSMYKHYFISQNIYIVFPQLIKTKAKMEKQNNEKKTTVHIRKAAPILFTNS